MYLIKIKMEQQMRGMEVLYSIGGGYRSQLTTVMLVVQKEALVEKEITYRNRLLTLEIQRSQSK
jgi:hypothetical protein